MDISRQRSFPNSTTAFAYDATIMQLPTGINSLERLRAAWIRVSALHYRLSQLQRSQLEEFPCMKQTFSKASVKSATVGFNFDVPVASAIWWSASYLLPAELILTSSIPERP